MNAALAGINTNMASGGDGITPKSALVTTHTARRSAATNLLSDGVPISEIMQLGGWKNEATLRHYLLAGGIQLAKLSADRAFFFCRVIPGLVFWRGCVWTTKMASRNLFLEYQLETFHSVQ